MKSNLRRKLFLSVAATAACAATLTSTTFAWYTSNSSVTTDSVNAATASTVDTGSIYIAAATGYSADKTASFTGATYSSSATPYLVNTAASTTLTMAPVYYDGTNYLPQGTAVDKYVALTGNAGESSVSCYSIVETEDTTVTSAETYTSEAATKKLYYKSGSNYIVASGYTANTKYYTLVATAETVAAGASLSGKYSLSKKSEMTYESEATTNQMEFVYRLRTANAGTATTVYFKDFALTNTTYAAGTSTLTLPTQTALVYDETGGLSTTGVTGSGAYSVDFLHALKMTLTITPLTSSETAMESGATVATKGYDYVAPTTTIYNFDSIATAGTHTTGVSSSANAIGYYNAAVGANISAPSTYNTSTLAETALYNASGAGHTTALSFDIPATGYVEVRFVFWLDGWDEYCYDTCLQQSFSFGTNFTVNDDEASGAFIA